MIGLLERRKIKIKKRTLFATKSRCLTQKNRNKIKLASDKSQQNNFTYLSLAKIWDMFSMRLVIRSTENSKKLRISKISFYFWKQLIASFLMSLDINWNQSNVHLYLLRKQLRHYIIQKWIARNFKANWTYDYCNKLKRKQKSFKMYKYKKISKILWNFVATVVPLSRNKSLKLKLL